MHESYEVRTGKYAQMYFKLYKSDKRLGMYQQIDQRNGNLLSYEVTLLKYQKASEFPKGVFREAKWISPTERDWGVLGWTYLDGNDAEVRYSKLIEEGKHEFPEPKE